MKILLLSLLLVVLCDAQLPLRLELTQLSGPWRTMYMAASNLDKLSENGVFRGYIRRINVDVTKRTISFDFFLKVNGQCVEKSATGTIGQNELINVDYEGTNDFQIVYLTPNSMVAYDTNVDLEGKTTHLVLFAGKVGQIEEKAVEKFKELTRQKNIPEENIVKIIDFDDCPADE